MANQKRKPSNRQIIATKKVLEGMKISPAMREAGYTDATAKNPKNLTKSPYFIDIMEKHGLTDTVLAQTMKEGLQATSKRGIGYKKDFHVVDEPDYATRHKYLSTALKLKGYTQPENSNNTELTGMVIILDGNTDQADQEADSTITLAE